MIDKNVPWRLVADLASPIMQEYMVRHKTSLENVFNTHFSRAIKRVSGITPKIYQRSISAQTRL